MAHDVSVLGGMGSILLITYPVELNPSSSAPTWALTYRHRNSAVRVEVTFFINLYYAFLNLANQGHRHWCNAFQRKMEKDITTIKKGRNIRTYPIVQKKE
jgi:hypothetical protein